MSLKNTSFYGPVLAVTALVVAPDSIDGRFTLKKPVRVDRVLNLSGTWIIPPFAEAHNHNIKDRSEGADTRAIEMYLANGVFYVKIRAICR